MRSNARPFLAIGLLATACLHTASAADDQAAGSAEPESYTEIHTWVSGYTDVYPDGTQVTHPGYWRVTRAPAQASPQPQDQDQADASSSPQSTTTVIQECPAQDCQPVLSSCGAPQVTVIASCDPAPCYAPTPRCVAPVLVPLPPLPRFSGHHDGFPLPPVPSFVRGFVHGGGFAEVGHGGHGGGWGGGGGLHLGGGIGAGLKLALLPLTLLGSLHR